MMQMEESHSIESLPNAVLFVSKESNNEFRKKLSRNNEIEINNKYYSTVLQIYDYDDIPNDMKFDACILYNYIPDELPNCDIQILVNERVVYKEGWEHCHPHEYERVLEALQAHHWPIMDNKQPVEFSVQSMMNWRDDAEKMDDKTRRNFISEKMLQFEDAFE